MSVTASQPSSTTRAGSPWAPLGDPVFRMLWSVWLTANLCMWMNDVAAAWMMTTLTHSPVMVALVQTASTLPVFLLGVPSGALADIVDRRRYFMITQFWVAATAILLAVLALLDALNAQVLLVLTFVNGIGLAMRWPVFAAIVPGLVPRPQLPAAMALNGVAMNASRIVGPMVAGALLAAAGSAYVFMLNAVLSVGAGLLITRWKTPPQTSALPGERFFGAIRVGLQYVRQSPPMHRVMLRVAMFFLQSTALLALLPLVATQLQGGGAGTFTLLLAAMGFGAIGAASLLPRLRSRMSTDELVRNGTFLQAISSVAVAFAPHTAVALAAMFVAGAAWITAANSLTVSAQMALPDWVRARGMSIYQMALMGGSATGAALWGQVAAMTDVKTSLTVAAVTGVAAWGMTRGLRLGDAAVEDLTPARAWKEPVTAFPVHPDRGPVMVTVTYDIDPDRAADFHAVMMESRISRLKHGVLVWELFRDTSRPGRYIEYFIEESWVAHLRRFERMTATEVLLQQRKASFQSSGGPPLVSRYVAEPVDAVRR